MPAPSQDDEDGARRVRQKAQQPAMRDLRAEQPEQAHGTAPVEATAAGGAALLNGRGAPERAAAPKEMVKEPQQGLMQVKIAWSP